LHFPTQSTFARLFDSRCAALIAAKPDHFQSNNPFGIIGSERDERASETDKRASERDKRASETDTPLSGVCTVNDHSGLVPKLPRAEPAPKSEHSKSEHSKSEHNKSEHNKSEHSEKWAQQS
jgi:hypothetical protein